MLPLLELAGTTASIGFAMRSIIWLTAFGSRTRKGVLAHPMVSNRGFTTVSPLPVST